MAIQVEVGNHTYEEKEERKNRIVAIGYTGMQTCYLNLTKEEAINRFLKKIDMKRETFDDVYEGLVKEIEFKDEFSAYEVW